MPTGQLRSGTTSWRHIADKGMRWKRAKRYSIGLSSSRELVVSSRRVWWRMSRRSGCWRSWGYAVSQRRRRVSGGGSLARSGWVAASGGGQSEKLPPMVDVVLDGAEPGTGWVLTGRAIGMFGEPKVFHGSGIVNESRAVVGAIRRICFDGAD